MRIKLQNAYLYKTALSPRPVCVFKQQGSSKLLATMRNGVFFIKAPQLNLKTTPRNYSCSKRMMLADDVVSDTFWWHTETNWRGYRNLQCNNRNLQCKLLLSGGFCVCNQAQRRRKVLFSGLKFINMTSLDNDSRKVQQSDSSKQPQRENSQICLSPLPTPPPKFKRGGHRPQHLKICSRTLLGVLFCTASQITRLGECAHLPQMCTGAVHKLTHNYHGYQKWRRQDR